MFARDAVRRTCLVVLAAVVVLLAGAASDALAASFTVNTTVDGADANGCSDGPCTLREAIIRANALGGSSTITLPAGTYDLTIPPSGNDDATTGDLNVTAAITINGAGAATTIIDGGGSSGTVTDRIFRVESTGSLALSGATIQHGHPAGGNGTLSEGGGILALGPLTLTDARVSNNFVETPNDNIQGAGAGISQQASVPVSLTRVTVSNNTVNLASGVIGGGGGLMLAGGQAGPITITDSTISGNTAAGPGGGIYTNATTAGGAITITGTTISGNHAALPPGLTNANHAWGGGLATDGFQPVTLTDDTISGNTADQSGGGIFDNGSSTYTITNTSILDNTAVAGCTCGVDFVGGGGIVADGGNINPGWMLTGDTIANNTAGSTNNPSVPGGGIDEDGGDKFTVVNTTITGNTASGIGGGYESSGGGTHKLTNVTIDGNTSGSGGADLDSAGGHFTVANTLVAHGNPVNCAFTTSPTSLGHNLDTGTTCGFNATGDLTNRATPGLGPLADNGGATQTEALLNGSPAIDAGDNSLCPAADQRGAPRPQGPACDIGAYERLQSPFVTNANDSGAGSLRQAIAYSQPGDTVDFSPFLDGQTITLSSGALVISHDLTIAGPGAASLAVSGNHASRVFDIEAGRTGAVTISGLTIRDGSFTTDSGFATGGGGIVSNGGALTLDGVIVAGNAASISSSMNSELFSSGGGGIYINGFSLTLTNSTVSNNTLTLTGSSGGNGGGGIGNDGGATVISGSTITGNTVTQNGTSSSATGDGGGGIYDDGGGLTLTNSTVSRNSDSIDAGQGYDGGGGILENGARLTVTNSDIDGNTFTLSSESGGGSGGGGIYDEGGSASTITSSSIDGNTTTITGAPGRGGDGGGGLFNGGAPFTITGSTIADNTGTVSTAGGANGGGGVYDLDDTTYLNSTFSGNSLTVNSGGPGNGGGAIYTDGGTGSVSDVTIAGNSINAPGGAIFDQSGTYTLKNSILAGNGGSPAENCALGTQSGNTPKFTSAGFNLESASTCGLNAVGDLTNTDPILAPLQNNGGPTPTQALSAGSPAVDAGSCTDVAGNLLGTDQRGIARPQPAGGKCDIGAYELVPAATQNPPPPPPAPPAAQTGPPTGETSTGATVAGTVNPENQATTYFFQYGVDPRLRPPGGSSALYDQSTPPQPLLADSNTHTVSATITNLLPNALYHVRLVAVNAAGTTYGPDQTFTTSPGPPPPPPVLGQTVNAKPVSGQVFVLVGTTLVPLTEGQQLPSGAIVDARQGTLRLTAATPAGHKPETGIFGGAIFKLTQSHAGLTTLTLAEGAVPGAPSYALCRPHHTPDARAAALSSRTLQLLHASAHGKFRTGGRYSAATVRGTKWTIADRCDGTLTHDLTDSVTVTDFVRHRTIALHAGESYLARARTRR